MSINLFTPGTGFPDLEVKIAYGLARVGIEAGLKFSIIPEKGFYTIEFEKISYDRLKQSFLNILVRLLSSDRFFDLGVKAKDKGKYSVKNEIFENLKDTVDFSRMFNLKTTSNLNIKRDMFCGHSNVPCFGGSSGLILISSFHAGKPYERDKRAATFNQSLCAVCGYLAVLGLYSFGFNIQMGQGKNRKFAVILPIPKNELKSDNLAMLLSLQKTLHNFWLSDIQPLRTFTVGLLAKVPALSDVVNELHLTFHLSLACKDNRGDTAVEQTETIDAFPFSKFISSSSYNPATVIKLLGSFKVLPKIASLVELTKILEKSEIMSLTKFARLYTQETSPKKGEWVNLLYPETAKYLLREVAMIRSEIIENPAIGSLARTLRYFIRERKYGYADDIRNARKESRDFEETVAKMLREGELRRVQQEQERQRGKKIDNWIHMPKEAEIKEIFRIASEDFESTKLALVMLAFSFPAKDELSKESDQEGQNERKDNSED
ncbi:MAG: type I-A CRISPR-associated protein Csa5 [Candidatus Omnitrophica bacterium]|nr:type I-A CRISPR-associated protein Csa5 [Candidatus Omnitrophota bacterium]